MSDEAKKRIFTQEDMKKVLDACYQQVLDGIPKVSKPIEEFAEEYSHLHSTKVLAAKAMIRNQIIKCGVSGFVTGFGGAITLPVAIPANLSSVLYVQLRMIACTAHMAGFDLHSDQVQTFVYACLAGVAVNGVVKSAGIKLGVKMANALVEKIPGKVLVAINQKVGFKLVTKFGARGLVNLGKMIPVVGAVVGGGLDLSETKVIGGRAIKWFFENNFDMGESIEEDPIIIDEVNSD